MRARRLLMGFVPVLLFLIVPIWFLYWYKQHPKEAATIAERVRPPQNAAELQSAYRTALRQKNLKSSQRAIFDLFKSIDPALIPGLLRELEPTTDQPRSNAEMERLNLFMNLFGHWFHTHPVEATAYATQLPSGAGKNVLQVVLRFNEVDKNPESGLHYLSGLPDESQRFREAVALLPIVARHDPDKAEAWAAKNLTSEHVAFLAAPLYSAIAEKDPKTAVKRALALTDPKAQRNAVESVVEVWANTEPQSALRWARHLEREDLCFAAIVGAIAGWAVNDAKGASAYVLKIETPELQKEAAQRVSTPFGSVDPEGALAWSQKLPPDARHAAQFGIAMQWLRRDRPAAEKWIATSDLPPERKEQLLKGL